MDIDSSSSVESTSPPPAVTSTDDNITPTNTLTSSDRIADLNEIDLSVSTLLSSASKAVAILSGQTSLSSSSSLDQVKADFTSASQLYFSTLSKIEVRLRRQVYALEEAGLIPSGDDRDTRRGRNLNNDDLGAAGGRRADAGAGVLDPSWLNARAVDKVEQAKKEEVLKAAKEFILQTRRREYDQDGEQKPGANGKDTMMEDDNT